MRKSNLFTGLLLILMGTMVLLYYLGKPRVEALHGADIVGLMASGVWLGLGIAGLLGRLKIDVDSAWGSSALSLFWPFRGDLSDARLNHTGPDILVDATLANVLLVWVNTPPTVHRRRR